MERTRLCALAGCLLLLPLSVAFAALADTEESPSPIALESGLEPTSTAWAKLWVEVENRAAKPLVGWSFEVSVNGTAIDGYDQLMMLKPIAPGDSGRFDLHRLATPEKPFDLSVTVTEVFEGEAVVDGERHAWRLLEAADGLPVQASQRVEKPRR